MGRSIARRRRLWIFAITVIGLIPWLLYLNVHPEAIDAHAYYAANLSNLYGAA